MNRILLVVSLLLCTNSLYGQQNMYKLEVSNESLQNIFISLERDYGLLFSYKQKDVNDIRVNVSISDNDLISFLDQLFRATNLNYNIVEGSYILLSKKKKLSTTNSTSQFRSICGTVINLHDRVPMSYANIYLTNSSAGTSTDANGKFTLKIEENTIDTLQISYIGFQTISIPVEQFTSVDCQTVEMTFQEYEDLYLVITDYISDGISLRENGSSTVIKPQLTANMPGQVEPDVLSTIKFLPGITGPSSKASDIYIRGCTPDQTLLLWEGIPIYHSAHYFGMITAFNPYTIDQINVYRGGFSAEYGGRIGGVINLNSADLKDTKSVNGIGTNMTHAYAYTNQYIDQSQRTSISMSLRRTFSELTRTTTFNKIARVNEQSLLLANRELGVLPDNITIEDDFNFWDSHLKISSQVTSKDRIDIAGIIAQNNFTDEIVDSRRRDMQIDEMVLSNYGASLHWIHNWSNNISSDTKASWTSYDYDYNYALSEIKTQRSRVRLSGIKSNMINDRQLQISNYFKLSENYQLTAGYHLIDYNIDFQVEEKSQRAKDIISQGQSESHLHSIFFKFDNPIQNFLGLNLGLRGSYFENDQSYYWEPRLSIAYQLNDNISLHAYAGRHHQFVSQVYEFRGNSNGINTPLWVLAGDKKLPIQKADLIQLGAIIEKKSWLIDLQAYKRNISGITSRAYEFEMVEPDEALVGRGIIEGIDILLKKRFKNFNSWISYSLSKSDMNFKRISKSDFPSDYDQRHVLQLSNQLKYREIEVSLGLKYSSGLPYSLINDFRVTSQPNEVLEYVAEYDGLNNYKLSPQTELNFSASYNYSPKNSDLRAYISFSVTNLLNRQNTFQRNYYVDSPDNQLASIKLYDKNNLSFTPNLNIRIEW